MTIQQLQYVLEIYRTSSISLAAEKLFVAQANLSNSVRALERELGFPIFIRSNKGVRCTEEGFRVVEEAGQILRHHSNLFSIQTSYASCRIGGTIYTPMREAFNKLCIEYSEMEKLDLSYDVLSFSNSLEQLFLSSIDLAVGISSAASVSKHTQAAQSKGFEFLRLYSLPVVFRIGREHPLYNVENVKPEDFSQYIFVDQANTSFLSDPKYLSIVKPNLNRVILAGSPESKLRLVMMGKQMYSVGAKLPDYLNERYGFRNIPIDGMSDCIMYAMFRKENRTEEVNRYLELLDMEMEGI